jgi:hypothetical protein
MAVPELHRTLAAAVEAVSPPAGSGLVVTEVDIDIPLEVVAGVRDGRPVFGGTVPHSRWRSGFLPEVHMAHLTIQLLNDPSARPSHVPPHAL